MQTSHSALKTDIHEKMLDLLRKAGVGALSVSTNDETVSARCHNEAEADKTLAFYGRVGLKNGRKEKSRVTGTWFARAESRR